MSMQNATPLLIFQEDPEGVMDSEQIEEDVLVRNDNEIRKLTLVSCVLSSV